MSPSLLTASLRCPLTTPLTTPRRRLRGAFSARLLAALLVGGVLVTPAVDSAAQVNPARDTGPAGSEQASASPEATADTPDSAASAMAPLAHWAGHWRGEGWIRMGPGEPALLSSEEWVEAKLGGEALVIEGLHHAREGGQVVHQALALLTWDAAASTYRFRTQVVGRGPGEFTGRLEDDGTFVWGGPAGPAGEMRYIIELEGDRWHEVGEIRRDGETWTQFFEMTLHRVGGSDTQPPPGERQDP